MYSLLKKRSIESKNIEKLRCFLKKTQEDSLTATKNIFTKYFAFAPPKCKAFHYGNQAFLFE